MKKSILTFCLCAFIFSISFAQEGLTKENRKTLKEAVEKRSEQFWNLFTNDYNAENLQILKDFLVETDDESWLGKPAFWIRNDEIYYVKDEIEEGFEMAFANRISTPTKIKENYYAVIAADVVIEVMTQDYYIISESGNRSPDFRASFTIVWVLKEDQWKIIHLHKSQFDKE